MAAWGAVRHGDHVVVPIHDENPTHRVPVVTWLLIAVNVAVFLASPAAGAPLLHAASPARECAALAYYQQWGAIPVELLRNQPLPETAGPPAGSGSCLLVPAASGKVPALSAVTSLFIHAGWLHLIGNMLFLWVFADNIEATIGNFHFLLFYLIGGLAAHAAHIYFHPYSGIPTVGASGAISAVMGAYLVMFPTSRVRMLFIFFIFRVPALLFLGFWIWQQWLSGTAALSVETVQSAGVAWWAHIGGFIFGVIAGFYFRFNYPRPQMAVYSGDRYR